MNDPPGKPDGDSSISNKLKPLQHVNIREAPHQEETFSPIRRRVPMERPPMKPACSSCPEEELPAQLQFVLLPGGPEGREEVQTGDIQSLQLLPEQKTSRQTSSVVPDAKRQLEVHSKDT